MALPDVDLVIELAAWRRHNSGEGARGPDGSRHARCRQCDTRRPTMTCRASAPPSYYHPALRTTCPRAPHTAPSFYGPAAAPAGRVTRDAVVVVSQGAELGAHRRADHGRTSGASSALEVIRRLDPWVPSDESGARRPSGAAPASLLGVQWECGHWGGAERPLRVRVGNCDRPARRDGMNAPTQ
jgi:hypothetical protein